MTLARYVAFDHAASQVTNIHDSVVVNNAFLFSSWSARRRIHILAIKAYHVRPKTNIYVINTMTFFFISHILLCSVC